MVPTGSSFEGYDLRLLVSFVVEENDEALYLTWHRGPRYHLPVDSASRKFSLGYPQRIKHSFY